ncbi:MAG: F0F1 ATP synthase subunit A, partial [Limisphaerales bacterium]
PTASLSTTAALAIAVFVAVPVFGIAEQGVRGFLKEYIEPNFLLLPVNILSEFTRTIALAVRLFGNAMSGMMLAAVVLLLAPLFFPILLSGLELLIGFVQAYVFATLATVYIAAAVRTHNPAPKENSYG